MNSPKNAIKTGIVAAALLAASTVGAATLTLTDDRTVWTDLSALAGYDGVMIGEQQVLILENTTAQTLDKALSGAGKFVKAGSGELTMTAASPDFDGEIKLAGTGTVHVKNARALGSATGKTVACLALATADGDPSTTSGATGATVKFYDVTIDEPIDIRNDNGQGTAGFHASEGTVTFTGTITLCGTQTRVVAAEQNVKMVFANGLEPNAASSVSKSVSFGAARNAEVVFEKPNTVSLFNSPQDWQHGTLVYNCTGNVGGYCWIVQRCDVDYALDNVDLSWGTGGQNTKLNLNGHPQRVSSLKAADRASYNCYVTSPAKAFLHVAGTGNYATPVPFKDLAGLYYEGTGTMTMKMYPSDSKGDITIVSGKVVMDSTTSWKGADTVTLSGTGGLELADVEQISRANLVLSDIGTLTLPANATLRVGTLVVDGLAKDVDTYSAADLNEHLTDNGAKIEVTVDGNYVPVTKDVTMTVGELESLVGDKKGVMISTGVTLTLAVDGTEELKTTVTGGGTLAKTGTGSLEMKTPNLIVCPFDLRAGSVHIYDGAALAAGSTTTVHGKDDAAKIYFHAVETAGALVFETTADNKPLQVVGNGVTTLKGSVTAVSSQLTPVVESGSDLVFAGGFSSTDLFRSGTIPSGSVLTFRDVPGQFAGIWTGTYQGRIDFSVASNAFNSTTFFFCSASEPSVRTTVPWAIYDPAIDAKKNIFGSLRLDICGGDQGCSRLNSTVIVSPVRWRPEGYIESATAAQMHVMGSNTDNDQNDLNFKGMAGLALEASKTLTLYGTSTGTGRIDVRAGELVFDHTAGTDTNYGDWERWGSWSNASVVAVCETGKLTLKHAVQVFGKETEVRLDGEDARIGIADGTVQTIGALYLDGKLCYRRMTFGGPDSPAQVKDVRFTGTGVLRTSKGIGQGLMLMVK